MADVQFPILVNERESKNPTSYMVIRRVDDFMVDDSNLFYLVEGALRKAENYRSPSVISVASKNGRDDEGDRAYIAQFDISNLTFESAWEGAIVFTGWMTTAKFYLDDESPIDRRRSDDEDAVYRYTPPARDFTNLKLPLHVEITLYYEQKKVTKRLDEAMIRHAEAREERAAKRAAEAEERRIRREKAAEEEAAWLLTEEGKDYAAEAAFNKEVKKFYNIDFDEEGAEEGITEHLTEYLDKVSEDILQRIMRSLNSRSYRYPRPMLEGIVKNITEDYNQGEETE